MKTIERSYVSKNETAQYDRSEAMLTSSGTITIHNYDMQGNSEMLMLSAKETNALYKLMDKLYGSEEKTDEQQE